MFVVLPFVVLVRGCLLVRRFFGHLLLFGGDDGLELFAGLAREIFLAAGAVVALVVLVAVVVGGAVRQLLHRGLGGFDVFVVLPFVVLVRGCFFLAHFHVQLRVLGHGLGRVAALVFAGFLVVVKGSLNGGVDVVVIQHLVRHVHRSESIFARCAVARCFAVVFRQDGGGHFGAVCRDARGAVRQVVVAQAVDDAGRVEVLIGVHGRFHVGRQVVVAAVVMMRLDDEEVLFAVRQVVCGVGAALVGRCAQVGVCALRGGQRWHAWPVQATARGASGGKGEHEARGSQAST